MTRWGGGADSDPFMEATSRRIHSSRLLLLAEKSPTARSTKAPEGMEEPNTEPRASTRSGATENRSVLTIWGITRHLVTS